MVGYSPVVHIVWGHNFAFIDVPPPNYCLLDWRNPHINGVGFPVLTFYDIQGLSAIISRTMPHKAIRDILGATGAGRPELCLHPPSRYFI